MLLGQSLDPCLAGDQHIQCDVLSRFWIAVAEGIIEIADQMQQEDE